MKNACKQTFKTGLAQRLHAIAGESHGSMLPWRYPPIGAEP
jgi:hypothetical protein